MSAAKVYEKKKNQVRNLQLVMNNFVYIATDADILIVFSKAGQFGNDAKAHAQQSEHDVVDPH